MKYDEAIDYLGGLNLSTYPVKGVTEAISTFGAVSYIKMTLHEGKMITRVRSNKKHPTFTKRDQLSFIPPEYNTEFGRASTPRNTMFYGVTIPDDVKPIGENNPINFATFETARIFRRNIYDGRETMSFGQWRVTKDIPLLAICYSEYFTKRHAHTKELNDLYMEQLSKESTNTIEKSLTVTNFLANEFAKVNHIRKDYEYIISAIFTEMSVKNGMAGVYYPSVRADGQGFNVALTPYHANNSLKLIKAGEYSLYSLSGIRMPDLDLAIDIHDDSLPFTMVPVRPELHLGSEKVIEKLRMMG